MSCIWNIPKEDRHCEYCSAICDERPQETKTMATTQAEFKPKKEIRKMNVQNNTTPVRDEREHHLYVTIQSASEASRKLAARVNRRWKEKNIEEKKKLVAEIIDTYLPHNKVTEQERKTVRTDDFISLMYGEGDMVRYYDLNICNLHEPIKPVIGTIKISLTHWLALNEIDREAIEIKEREEKMYDDYFRNIVYMREKECIEEMLPEAMMYLRFEPFVYDTQFLSEMARKVKI